MASVKLVNGTPLHHHHHSLYSHHHHPFILHHHHSHLVTPSSSAPGHSMTLDYSLPNRSRLGDADRSELTTNSIEHASDSGQSDSHQSYSDSNSHHPPSSPRPTSLPSSAGSEHHDPSGNAETPTKKNKRKLSEPRRRSDIGESLIADSPRETNSSCSDSEEETHHTPEIKIPKLLPHSRVPGPIHDSELDSISKRSSSPLSYSSSKLKSNSVPSRKKKSPSLSNNEAPSSPTPSTSASPAASSSSSSHVNHSTQPDNASHDGASSAMPNGIHPPFLHPFLSAVPPAAAFGFVPGLYFGGQPYPPSALPASFPAIPLHLQQSYLAAAAAAAAQSAAASTTTSPSTSAPSSSQPSDKVESSPFYKHHESSSHPVILQPPQLHNSYLSHKPPALPTAASVGGGGPPSIPGTSQSTLPTASSSSSYNKQCSSRSLLDNQNDDDDDDDDDDDESSRVHSPEDLSLGGKMSRKHRKNYKNMTRERRVEANARERTRVHTISAAFDALRRAVPSYSYNQKLSKLAILRIACSYIMSLARLADMDYTSASEHIQKPLTFAECVDMCTNTIQTEGRARRRH